MNALTRIFIHIAPQLIITLVADFGSADAPPAAPIPVPTPVPAPIPTASAPAQAVDPLDAISLMPSPERPPEPLTPVPVPVEQEDDTDAFGDFGGAAEAVPPPAVEPSIIEVVKPAITEVEPTITIDTVEEPMSPPKNERGDNDTSLSFDAMSFSLESAPQPSIKELKESPKALPKVVSSSPKAAMMMPPPMAENTDSKLSVFDALRPTWLSRKRILEVRSTHTSYNSSRLITDLLRFFAPPPPQTSKTMRLLLCLMS